MKIDHSTAALSSAAAVPMSLASVGSWLANDPTLRLVVTSALAGLVGVLIRALGELARIAWRAAAARYLPAAVSVLDSRPPEPPPPSTVNPERRNPE